MSISEFQKQARSMVKKSQDLKTKLTYQQALELIASLNGFKTWVALKVSYENQEKKDKAIKTEKELDEYEYYRLDYFAHVKDSGSFYILVNKQDYKNFIKTFNSQHDYKLDEHGLITEYAVFSKQLDKSDVDYIIEVEQIEKEDYPMDIQKIIAKLKDQVV